MTIRRPYNNFPGIGREFQFNDPTKNTNKKHFWAEGNGNLGFLTTEQIQYINQHKQRQKRAHLHKYKNQSDIVRVNNSRDYIRNGLNEDNQNEPRHKEYLYEDKSKQQFKGLKNINQEMKNSHVRHKTLQLKQQTKPQFNQFRNNPKTRIKSQLRDYEPMTPGNKIMIHKLSDESSHRYYNNTREDSALNKLINKQKMKTQGSQQNIDNLANPQQSNYLPNSQLLARRKSRIQIDSGNVRLTLSPQNQQFQKQQSHENFPSIGKNNGNDSHVKFKIDRKPAWKLGTRNGQTVNNTMQQKNQFLNTKYFNKNQTQDVTIDQNLQTLQKVVLKQKDAIYKSKKMVEPKLIFSRNRFRRDFSPTFCNSFDYPLPYFRHV